MALQKKKNSILKKREGRKMCFSWRGNSSFKDISAFLFNNNSLFGDNLAFLLNRQNGIRVTGKITSLEEAR